MESTVDCVSGRVAPASDQGASQEAERIRVLELLRYFQPSTTRNQNDKARVASDTSLTAYAQLCAFKMNCQRSFISLMDDQNQYIIAEATRSLSLRSEDVHDGDDDAIYLGATMLDLIWGVCPNTIKLFTSSNGSLNVASQYVKATESYYVMNDLSKVPGFENRPYVAGWPYMRYYAEVPIHSPSGYTIGTLCVVDDAPRDGLDKKGLMAMKEVADAVMNHLELVVSKVQRRRDERMIQNLGLFVEGGHGVRQWWMSERLAGIDEEHRAIHHVEKLSDQAATANSQDSITSLIQNNKAEGFCDDQTSNSQPFENCADPETTQVDYQSWRTSAADSLAMEPVNTAINSREGVSGGDMNMIANDSTGNESQRSSSGVVATTADSHETLVLPDLENLLLRATTLIREAVDLDGVASFDPRLGNSRLQDKIRKLPKADIRDPLDDALPILLAPQRDKTSSDVSSAVNKLIGSANISEDTKRYSKVLACSTRISSNPMNTSTFPWILPEPLLHRIVEIFPRGGVLNFDAKGFTNRSEIELIWDGNVSKSREPHLFDSSKVPHDAAVCPDGNILPEARELWHILPNVRSILLFPLWNLNDDKLIAYSVAWTTNPTRVFHGEDFAYLASFANLIKAELSRLDVVAADRAKADFISSISHELRSPLHGMLATAELLKESINDPISNNMIDTIEACGSTLLDTMDNLLTFAKINSATVTQEDNTTTIELARPGQRLPQTLRNMTKEVDLESLVEEVMNASVAGHQFCNNLEMHVPRSAFHSGATANSKLVSGDVTIICDIEPQRKWRFKSQAGAWKRILMNLVGNSLKYTTAGFIHVRLWQGQKSISKYGVSETSICLSVEDSGQGISEDYLKNHLFKPFRQEDPLSPGTGLGLSIVRQLATSINGSIEITSNAGSGTMVKVTALLESSPDVVLIDHEHPSPVEKPSMLHGRSIGVMPFERRSDTGKLPAELLAKLAKRTQILRSYLACSAKAVFGMSTVTISSLDADFVDIFVTTESAFRSATSSTALPRTIPLIVLCDNVTLDYRPVSNENGPVVYLSQPFGPQKLRRAFELCVPYCRPISQVKKHQYFDPAVPLPAHLEEISKISHSAKSTTMPLTSPPIFKAAVESTKIKSGSPRALLVEDNPINLKLLTTFMARLGCPYSTATDGLQAVELYRDAVGRFDIILMDIQMPRMDGIAASNEVRKFEIQEVLSRTLIIALTGLASVNVQEQAKLNGIDIFLTKPVALKKLKGIIDDHFPSSTDMQKS